MVTSQPWRKLSNPFECLDQCGDGRLTRLVEDIVEQRLPPRLDGFDGCRVWSVTNYQIRQGQCVARTHLRVQRLVILGTDDFVQIIGSAVNRGKGVLVDAGDVGVASFGQVMGGRGAKGAASESRSALYQNGGQGNDRDAPADDKHGNIHYSLRLNYRSSLSRFG